VVARPLDLPEGPEQIMRNQREVDEELNRLCWVVLERDLPEACQMARACAVAALRWAVGESDRSVSRALDEILSG
jgi:hypothetical protein